MATSPNIRCQLTEWGLPPLIVSWFRKHGITSLFEWQVECLCKDDVLFGGNLVYSAPTSAGKTLVADFLLLKRVLEYGKKALVIEPFVALTREKANSLKSMLYTTKARVGAFGGNYYTPGGMAAVSVAVCTIEKANNFINKLINENKLSDLGIIVVDEIHNLGDERRGYQLELLLTKVLFFNSQRDKGARIQIVGLSATLPNLESIAVWLKASLYITRYRPVALVEKIKIENRIYDVKSYLQDASCEPIEIIDHQKIMVEKDYDDICYICIESILNGHSTLVFCESKRECEITAANLASQIKFAGSKLKSENPVEAEVSRKLRESLSAVKLQDVLDKLKKCPAGTDRELAKSLTFGVAFHHAGLTTEEREIIEDGFKCGSIKALMATSTLSSGVNLPARRVVIKSPLMFCSSGSSYSREMLNPITYRQMIGRAGRKNIDTSGESILMCKPENQDVAMKLIRASLGNINSSLAHRMIASEGEPSGLKKAVLEVIANTTVQTRNHLNQYLESTFWITCSFKKEEEIFKKAITETLRYLVKNKFIEELKPGVYKSTRLGNAVLASGLHPDESLELLQDLIKARQGFILLNDLHIIYQVTPNDIARSIELKDWHHFSKIWNDLDDVSQLIGDKVGIDEFVISRRCQGYAMNSLGEEKERIYRRFWVALVINDLINEMPLNEICSKYRVTKALVQQAQRAVAQFAGVMSIFCDGLGYDTIAALFTPLESRINFSCHRELLDLIRLNITRPIARALFKAGYKNVIAVAKGDKLDIEFVIRQTKPFRKDISFSQASNDAPSMWVPELAKTMTTLDYASHIVETAITYVEIEYDIDIVPSTREKEVDRSSTGKNDICHQNNSEEIRAAKRGRLDDGAQAETNNICVDDTPVETNIMERANSDVPNFVVKYVGRDSREVNKFLEKWITHSAISLNFKLTQHVNEPIGAKVKRNQRLKSRSRSESDGGIDNDTLSQDSQNGLILRLQIDNKQHILTRLYACFDDELIVYIIDNKSAFRQIRDHLKDYLTNSYASSTSHTATQRRADFVPVKLFTQNIVLTYKVLFSAFEMTQQLLNTHFEWHAFDVAWWMVNDCPTRGLNNRNSSLSLVSKTKWALKYHHFLYPSPRRPNNHHGSGSKSRREYLRLKDIVKSGKTAILKPLTHEIVDVLRSRKQLDAYTIVEIPSRITMAHMMLFGIGLNMKFMRDELRLYDDLSHQLGEVAQKYYAKSTVSLTNNKDVARVLYDDLDLKRHLLEHNTNSDISKDPTNGEILNILSGYHPFPKLVQDFRKIGKALEALQGVNTYAQHNKDLNMIRVFGLCDFWQLTGRVSMFDPDLFLINRNFKVTIPAHGTRDLEVIECAPRRCFVPFDGWILVAADYSQLELRLLAHFSDDSNLLQILNRSLESDETFDVFKTVAASVYKKPVEEVSDQERQHAKQICYGIIYGMGNKSLSIKLGVDTDTAEEFRQDFFSAFPRLKSYTNELVDQCEELEFVESLLGRRRIIDGIKSDRSSARSRAERVAINTRIQSSASDIIKLAMSRVNDKIINDFNGNARLVLEMHDELIYEVNPVFLSRFSRALKFTMEDITLSEGLKVKLLVNTKKGSNWSNLESFSPI